MLINHIYGEDHNQPYIHEQTPHQEDSYDMMIKKIDALPIDDTP